MDNTKQQEVWDFLTTKVGATEDVHYALFAGKEDYFVSCIEYWHKSSDANEHLAIAVMFSIFTIGFYHVYRNGTTRSIDEGRNIFYTTEEEIQEDGSTKKKRVWRFMDGGRPVNSDELKSHHELVKEVFG